MPRAKRSVPRKPRSTRGAQAVDIPLVLDGGTLRLGDVVSVSQGRRRVEIGAGALERIRESRAVVERATRDGAAHYGINTGFGSLAQKRIPPGDLRELQRNLVRSHAAGVGAPLAAEVVRGMMLLLAASLCRGLSGVRTQVVELLVSMLNSGVTPTVPELGSVGASGDLAPLAHVALVLLGEGRATAGGREMSGREALDAAGLRKVSLEAKEGLALINGTHLMCARGVLLCREFSDVFDAALAAAAMSVDACRGTDSFLDSRVHEARRQPGQRMVAARVGALLAGSQIIPSHRENDPRVQDPYSLRCTPAVLGAAWDAADYVRSCIEIELGAVTDNPLVFADASDREPVVSAGNFHGMPVALPLDILAIAVAHVAGISERRTFAMLAAADPEAHLTAYLSPKPGLHSGYMIAQYTAAACCNEIVGLAAPASVVNIPTSAGIEDYNSFGPRSAAKAARAMELARYVIAVELVCAAQGLEYHRPLKSGAGVERARAIVRGNVPVLTADRPPAPDIEAVASLIMRGAFREGERSLHSHE